MDLLQDMEVEEISVGPATRRRNQTACEACRTAKIRCQPSEQPGVCRKCLDSKRECVSRTDARNRRPRRARTLAGADDKTSVGSTPSSNPVSSSTFSIDFAVPAQPEVDDAFDVLRESHESVVDAIIPQDEDDFLYLNDPFPSASMPTPPASTSTASHSIESLHGKPQFNLTSAESLLASFHTMLPHFPCLVLSEDSTVPQLAATRPFVLLAILAATSGSRTLQGHNLYDEEFRKVLGLKFVAGGERTLELLQGVLVYCAWYPFHLRPKNKQPFRYLRMASDLIQDLELDQNPTESGHQLDGIRAYLAHYYLSEPFVSSWKRFRTLSNCSSAWISTASDLLERNAELDNDLTLVYLTRLTSIISAATQLRDEKPGKSDHQHDGLVMLGLETQLRDVSQAIPPHISHFTPVKMAQLSAEVFLNGGGLLTSFTPSTTSLTHTFTSPTKLTHCITSLSSLLTVLTSLPTSTYTAFTSIDWSRLVIAIVAALRLSFPLPLDWPTSIVQSFDPVWARSQLRLGEFLSHMCRDTDLTPDAKKVDVLSASRVIMKVVKDKFDRRMEVANRKEAAAASEFASATTGDGGGGGGGGARQARSGCPMLDGSLDQFIPLWDPGLTTADSTSGTSSAPVPTTGAAAAAVSGAETGGGGISFQRQQPPVVFHDLWATMTMGWATSEDTER